MAFWRSLDPSCYIPCLRPFVRAMQNKSPWAPGLYRGFCP